MAWRPLRVIIDATFRPEQAGGVGTYVGALIKALGELTDGDEEYVIVGPPEQDVWPKSILGPRQQVIPEPKAVIPAPSGRRHVAHRAVRFAKRLLHGPTSRDARALPESKKYGGCRVSDGFYESLGGDLIHFPWQKFCVCAMPSVYNPHDLQHLHLPQLFSPSDIADRESVFSAACRFATRVIVVSEWTRNDFHRMYGLSNERMSVVPWGAPTASCDGSTVDQTARVQERLGLAGDFMLYPAACWKHKNHVRLLHALARVRDVHGKKLTLVCSGQQGAGAWDEIAATIHDLRLDDQVRFVGYIPHNELRSLYHAATFVIVPTLFEAFSGPVFEAWLDGAPVTCSNVTDLPEQVQDAALLFDPWDISAIADAILRMTSDATLRDQLRERGRARERQFSWDRTARAYRAVYRQVARRDLTMEDRELLGTTAS